MKEVLQRLEVLESKVAYAGSFDGVVTNNEDPENKNRIKAQVKSVYGDFETNWATPIVPFAGDGYGVSFIPQVGDEVKILFKGCNVNTPEYIGQFWNSQSPPEKSEESSTVEHIIKTPSGHRITFNDKEDSTTLVIEHNNGSRIELNEDQWLISDATGKFSVISDSISLGSEDDSAEPVVLGNELNALLGDIINWLKTHNHPVGSPAAQAPFLDTILTSYQQLDSILSTKVTTD